MIPTVFSPVSWYRRNAGEALQRVSNAGADVQASWMVWQTLGCGS
jgi:hypothetical protein